MKQQRITHLLVVKKREARKMLEKLPSLQPAPDVASLSSHVLAHPCWPNIFQIGSLSVADGTAILTLLSPRKSGVEEPDESASVRGSAAFRPRLEAVEHQRRIKIPVQRN